MTKKMAGRVRIGAASRNQVSDPISGGVKVRDRSDRLKGDGVPEIHQESPGSSAPEIHIQNGGKEMTGKRVRDLKRRRLLIGTYLLKLVFLKIVTFPSINKM